MICRYCSASIYLSDTKYLLFLGGLDQELIASQPAPSGVCVDSLHSNASSSQNEAKHILHPPTTHPPSTEKLPFRYKPNPHLRQTLQPRKVHHAAWTNPLGRQTNPLSLYRVLKKKWYILFEGKWFYMK